MKRILDKSFRYRNADETSASGYLERRFKDIRRRQQEEQALKEERAQIKITPIKAAGGKK